MARPQCELVDGAGSRPHRPGRLVRQTGRREIALGLGFIVVRPGRDRRPPEPQPGIPRRRTAVQGHHRAQPLADLCASPQGLGLEGEVQELGYR
jgi:hypothetical protein